MAKRKGMVRVTCNTCEEDYMVESTKINIIYCDDTETWTFSFFCEDCGRLELGDLDDDKVQRLLKTQANLVVWDMPEIVKHEGPLFTNADLFDFQELLDSTDDIIGLVEAV